ncbi:MAG: hypothetical protein ABI151_13520 [Chitinophagaceae bacterium]
MCDSKTLKQRFKSSIKRGTGEAHLIIGSNPTLDFTADIIKSSLKNYAYNGQSEGSRALYISELILLSKKQEKIRSAILQGLASEQNDTWSLLQLFDLATILATNGDIEAKKAIYKRFFRRIIAGSDWCGYTSIIELDGLDGLKYIATTIGKALQKNPDDWQDGSIIRDFQTQYPSINSMHELAKASKENRFIKIYLDNVKRTEDSQEKYIKGIRGFSYSTVNEIINDEKRRIALTPVQAKLLSKKEIKKLADDFLKETNRQKLEKYLRIFNLIKYPYHYSPILEIAKSKRRKNDRLVEFAAGALKHFTGNDIRKFAIKILGETKAPYDYLDSLVLNYKKGDSKLLTTIVNNSNNEDGVHAMVYGLINIYKANNTKECKRPLEAVYGKLTCGIHRHQVVEILIDRKVLSKQIKAEIMYDSYEDTRQLITKK